MKKSAILYERGGALFFRASSLTTTGILVDSEPLLRIDPRTGSTAIGSAVVTVLDAFREEVPHPTDWTAAALPLLKIAGVRSWHTFMKRSRCVGLVLDSQSLLLTPCRNLGKGGFEPVTHEAIEIPMPSSPHAIGDAVLEVVTRCQ